MAPSARRRKAEGAHEHLMRAADMLLAAYGDLDNRELATLTAEERAEAHAYAIAISHAYNGAKILSGEPGSPLYSGELPGQTSIGD